MKKLKKFISFGIIFLTGCSFSISTTSISSTSEDDTSIISSDDNSSSYTTSSSETGTSETQFDENNFDYGLTVSNLNTTELNNEALSFKNIDCKVSTSGSVTVSSTSDAYRIGNSAVQGTLNIVFNSPILVESLSLYAKSTGSNFTQLVTYNDSKSFRIDINSDDFSIANYTFDNPTLLESLSFTCKGRGTSVLFKGLYFKKGQPIRVTGIEKVSDVEVEINRFIELTSTYKILPENATYKDITISSNDEFVVIDNNMVKVTTIGEHNVKITTVDGGFSENIIVNGLAVEILEGYRLLNEARFTYDDISIANQYSGCLPSIGDVNVLVVPVNFSDLTSIYDFNNVDNMNALKGAFSGTKADNSNDYFESLKSYYYKSSYGKLNLNFIYTDVLVPSISSQQFVRYSDDYGSETTYIVKDFYNNGKINNQKINFKDAKYDANNDGYVDGVWFIYNDNRASTAENFWPYVYWYGFNSLSDSSINISAYANCSVYFTYEDNNQGLDGHTLFHETGHLLGLDDYYVTDGTSNMSAIGGLDMMDYNIGDHNAFSKFSLGWINPYIVEDESIITLRPFESSGDAIIIPTSSFNDSAFSEYLIIEYYTPTGLNAFDAETAYNNRPYYYSTSGIRILHVDARLALISSNSSYNYVDKSITNLTHQSNKDYMVAGSNTLSYSLNGQHLVQIITKDNRSTYKGGMATNSSLFVEGDIMDPSKYTSFFTNSKMHDGSTFEYKIEILYIQNNECRISIKK